MVFLDRGAADKQQGLSATAETAKGLGLVGCGKAICGRGRLLSKEAEDKLMLQRLCISNMLAAAADDDFVVVTVSVCEIIQQLSIYLSIYRPRKKKRSIYLCFLVFQMRVLGVGTTDS